MYDYFVLLDREVEHIWGKEWNVSKILFILSRYGPFFDVPIHFARKSDLFPYPTKVEGMLTEVLVLRSIRLSV